MKLIIIYFFYHIKKFYLTVSHETFYLTITPTTLLKHFSFFYTVSHETLTIRYNNYTFFLIDITKFFFYFHITHFKTNVSHETNKQTKQKKYIYILNYKHYKNKY